MGDFRSWVSRPRVGQRLEFGRVGPQKAIQELETFLLRDGDGLHEKIFESSRNCAWKVQLWGRRFNIMICSSGSAFNKTKTGRSCTHRLHA